jgi:hypothetical protein
VKPNQYRNSLPTCEEVVAADGFVSNTTADPARYLASTIHRDVRQAGYDTTELSTRSWVALISPQKPALRTTFRRPQTVVQHSNGPWVNAA